MNKDTRKGAFALGTFALFAGLSLWYVDWLDAFFKGDVERVVGTYCLTGGLVVYGIWMFFELWKEEK